VIVTCPEQETEEWVALFQAYSFSQIAPEAGTGKVFRPRFKVVVNPVSGGGHAMRRWNQVKHLFAACDIDFMETQH
jgi:hypothetical protein